MSPSQPIPEDAVRRRAQQMFEQRGRIPGHEVEDWLRAEAELRRESASRNSAHVLIKLDGVNYTGEYDPTNCDGYHPGELAPGTRTRIRLVQDKMFIQRPNGKELETTIVNRNPALDQSKAG
jgi:DUF2934 family protein